MKDIQHLAENVILDASNAEENTRVQLKSKQLFQYRAGRITASNMKVALSTKLEVPSICLIKSVCYPTKKIINSKAIASGCRHENEARKRYIQVAVRKHENFICEKSGFIIDLVGCMRFYGTRSLKIYAVPKITSL